VLLPNKNTIKKKKEEEEEEEEERVREKGREEPMILMYHWAITKENKRNYQTRQGER